MKQEDEELLNRDLIARLHYRVIVRNIRNKENCDIDFYHPRGVFELDISPISPKSYNYQGYSCHIEDIRPYLRPMSSMTEEEMKEFEKIKLSYHFDEDGYVLFDWLNKHHFDYRCLIEKGLALVAPEGMYK